MAEDVKPAKPGNSGFDPKAVTATVERIERLEEEKKAIADDIKEVKREAAEIHGIPTKALNETLRDRKRSAKMEKHEWDELQDQIERLKHCLGDFGGTELGSAAIAAAEAGNGAEAGAHV